MKSPAKIRRAKAAQRRQGAGGGGVEHTAARRAIRANQAEITRWPWIRVFDKQGVAPAGTGHGSGYQQFLK
jgi:hypothetical protein